MTEHEALIEAILDHPDDDDRRLIYADWLEEHGSFADGIRAKLIRLEMKEWQAGENEKKAAPIAEQIKALRARYSWLMYPQLPPGFSRPELRGGIVRLYASLTAPRFIEWGEDYLRGLPPYCRLFLTLNRPPGKGKLIELLDSLAWPRVSVFSLEKYRFGDGEAARFFGDPRLRALEDLRLLYCQIGDEGLAALASSPHLGRLTSVVCYYDTITDAGLAALAATTLLPKLGDVYLDRGAISDAAVRSFERRKPKVELHLH